MMVVHTQDLITEDNRIMSILPKKAVFVVLALMLAASCSEGVSSFSDCGGILRFGATLPDTDADTTVGSLSVPTGSFPLQGWGGRDSLFLNENAEVYGNTCTKGAPVSEVSSIGTFGVFAYSYSGTWDAASSVPDFMYNVAVIKDGQHWSPDGEYTWPAGKGLNFYCYYPFGDVSFTVKSGADSKGYPVLSYTVPDDVKEQKDILVACTELPAAPSGNTVPISFDHALTAVVFKTSGNFRVGYVKSIKLKNVYGSGDLNLGKVISWSPSTTRDFTIEYEGLGEVVGPEQQMTDEEYTFMMIPQTLPDGAGIEIQFMDDATLADITLTASLSGTVWSPGNRVVYTVSTTSITQSSVFEVSEPSSVTYRGGTAIFNIKSHYEVEVGDNTKYVPISWDCVCVEGSDGSYKEIDTPDWIVLPQSKTGSTGSDGKDVSITVTEQSLVISNAEDEELRQASPVTDYDLSTGKAYSSAAAPENTANCYLVNAPGTYRFPLVYGNAIKGGADNKDSYSPSVSSSGIPNGDVLTPFINHIGLGITSPFIYENKDDTGRPLEPSTAELVWQDAENLITDIELSSDKKYVKFSVPAENIRQGNAVLSVKDDGGQVMWSWHIWVTPYHLGEDLKSVNSYRIMPLNIGWCSGSTEEYPERSVKLLITQDITGEQKVITVTQQSSSSAGFGNSTYYQWGRKDAFLPRYGQPKMPGLYVPSDKYWYDKDGGLQTTILAPQDWKVGLESVKQGILNPGILNQSQSVEMNYANLWASDYNTFGTSSVSVSTKSIYDPCPVGYKVPFPIVFKGFDYENPQSLQWIDNVGALFNSNSSENAFYLQALGLRDNRGVIVFDYTSAYYWASIYYGSGGYMIAVNNDEYGFYFSYEDKGGYESAYPIRPMTDE